MFEQATYWHLEQLELLKATFVTHSFVPHTHDTYVVGVIESGVEMFRRDSELYYATPNKVILVNPNQLHTGSAGVPEGWTYRTLYPTVAQMQQATQEIFETDDAPYFPKAVIADKKLAAQVRAFHQAAEQGTKLEQDSTFLTMLSSLVSRHAERALTLNNIRLEHEAVKKVKGFLETHPSAEISLQDLAKIASLSSFHLLRVFKKELGVTPHAYQIQQRVHLAKQFVKQGKTLAEVALETGFHDQSHMGFHFKRLVGVTPRQFVRGIQ
jgi:AraC-like DNA-binding protein